MVVSDVMGLNVLVPLSEDDGFTRSGLGCGARPSLLATSVV